MSDPGDLLSSSDELLRTIVQGALAAVVVMDSTGRVRGWGPRAASTFGWSREEAIGAELAELIVPPELRDRHRSGLARFVKTGEERLLGRIVEMEAVVRDGRRIPVEISINPPVRVNGQALFIAFVQDISQRKASEIELRRLYEEAQAANEALRDYTSLIVHELRGPLSVLTGYVEMLADGSLFSPPPQVGKVIEQLRSRLGAANDLVDRVLTAYGIDSAALEPRLEALDLATCAQEAVERASGRAELLGAVVESTVGEERFLALADRTWTATILDNLVNNALVHSGEHPRVTIRVCETPLALEVCDEGPGIPDAARAWIFERFVRLQDAGRGSGLGLYLSRRLAQRQGGDLSAEPSATGARFRLSFRAD